MVRETITSQLPYVIVNSVESSASETDKNVHLVNLRFSIDTDQTQQEELSIDVQSEGY